jgi:hypothetical protein
MTLKPKNNMYVITGLYVFQYIINRRVNETIRKSMRKDEYMIKALVTEGCSCRKLLTLEVSMKV